MRKITSFLLSMILALVAIPIQAAIQADVVIDQEFSSLAELEGKAFAIVNKETGKALFGTNNQNLGYDVLSVAFSNSNSGYYFKLDAPVEDPEDASIAQCHLLRLQTPAGEGYNIWGDPGYLNSQPSNGSVSFILGLKQGNGQDMKNGAVFDIQYVEGKGFTLLNKGTGLYLNDSGSAKYEEPVYWTFCTLKKDWMTAFKPLFDEEAAMKACGTSEEANAAYDAIVDPIKANVESGNIADAEADLATIDAALNDLAKAQTTAGADFTRLIVNREINGADGWTIERPLGGNGPLLGGTSFEYWAGNASDRSKASFDYYQVISGLVNGAYTVTADMYNSLNGEEGATWNATSGVYGKGANESVTLVNEDGMTLKPYTTGQVFVVDGTIRIGVKNTVTPMAARWFVADNFKLTYLGETAEYIEATKIPTYGITIAEGIANGSVNASETIAEEGTIIKLTATPANGYKLGSFTVMAGETPVSVASDGSFTMPAGAVTISATFTAMPVADLATGDYLIRNKETQKYLGGANSWGTQASLVDHGRIFTLTKLENGKYTFDSHTYNDYEYIHFVNGGYLDGASSEIGIYTSEAGTCFGGSGITLYAAPTTGTVVATNGVYEAANSVWEFIPVADAVADLAAGNTSDATFLLKDASISRNLYNSSFEKVWQGDGFSKGGPVENQNAEKWGGNSQTFDTYQSITIPNGSYTVSVQGFYRYNNTTNNDNNAAIAAHADGTEVIYSYLYANDKEVPFASIADDDAAAALEALPFSQADAAAAFAQDLYNNSLDVLVVDGTLKIGVKKIKHIGCDWTVWDNFVVTRTGELPSYSITVAEGIENGTISADVQSAQVGSTVTLSATPADGYKLSTFYVTLGDTPIDVTTAGTFVMPEGNVTISAVFEEAIPTLTATLVHTASSTRGNSADITNTVDADKEHVNNTNFNNVWAAAAYAEFSLAGLPKDATITKATLSFTGIGSSKDRTTDVMYVNAGESIDYENMPTSTTAVNLNATLIETVTFPANATTAFETDVTKALTKLTFSQKDYVIFKWTNNAGGGDIAGMTSENAPQLVIEYQKGAPAIANASFEADGEKAAEKGPLTLTGWTFSGVGSGYNNTELRPAGSSSSSSQFGTSDPSNGEYSLFFRHGWNGTGNTITITSDALAAIPSGDYQLSVDYKQYYSYDDTSNSNTKVGIAIVKNGETIGSATSPAASGVKGGNTNTYFNTAEWSTLTANFAVSENIPAGAQIVITLYAAGQKRSDFFIDNVQFCKIPSLQMALMNLEEAIAAAEAEAAKYHVGDKIFMYPAAEIEPLTTAIATAKAAYEAMESKETVDAATTSLNDVLTAFAPTMTKPEAGKMYTIALNVDDATLPVLNIAADKISVETIATPIEFVEQADGTFALSNGSEYIVYKGDNTWSLSGTSTAYGWTIAAVADGVYTIKGKNGYLGTDNTPAGSTCYGNKPVTGNVKWTISDCIPGTSVSATYQWGTFISQVDRTLPEGLKAYTCVGTTEDNKLQLEEAESIAANTAYILNNTTEADIVLPSVAAVSQAVEESYETGLLTGSYVQTNVPAGSYILQSQNGKTGFYLCETADRIVGKNRCYMTLPAGVTKARSFIFGEDGATGVPTLKAETLDKLSNGKIYDVNGREIKSLQKGINIIDGTKVNVR